MFIYQYNPAVKTLCLALAEALENCDQCTSVCAVNTVWVLKKDQPLDFDLISAKAEAHKFWVSIGKGVPRAFADDETGGVICEVCWARGLIRA